MKISSRITFQIYLWIGAALLCSGPLGAQVNIPEFKLTSKMEGLPLHSSLQYFRDQGGKLDIKQVSVSGTVSFRAVDRETFGYTSDVIWLKLEVRNPGEYPLSWFVLLDYTPMDSMSLYQRGDHNQSEKQGWIKTSSGDRHHFSSRSIWYRKPNLKVVTPANSTQTLYFRISGQSMLNVKLEAWSGAELTRRAVLETMILGGFYAAMFAIMVYNIFLYFFVRGFYYIAYVLYIFLYILFQMVFDGMAFQLFWPGALDWASIALPLVISLMSMSLLYFSMLFLDLKKNTPLLYKIQLGLQGMMGITIVLSLALGVEFVNWTVRLSILIGLPASILCLLAGLICYRRRVRSARYYLLAWASILTFGSFRSFEVLFTLSPLPFLSDYSIHIGALLLIFLFSVALANRFNHMRLKLGLKVRALNKANSKIDHSQRKYRQLVEASDDIIFSLDGDLKFLSINQTLEKKLGYREDELLGRSVYEIFYMDREHNRRMTESIFIRDKMDELKRTRGRVVFNLNLKSQHIHEPREMSITLEYIDSSETLSVSGKRGELDEDLKRVEILGHATSIADDIYSEYLIQENHSYAMESYLRNAELLSQKLTHNLSKYLDTMEVTSLRIALRELLINAIEHGNLSISFEDKTEALESRRYFELVQERQDDKRLQNRRVLVDYSLNPERIQIRIEDEGEGFDHRNFRRDALKQANAKGLGHGRGLVMAESEFDEMRFNEKGNEVVLVKYLGRK